MRNAREALAAETARIICEELLTDYAQAKRKAAARLGARLQDFPENREVHDAVLQHQQLFGGLSYRQYLHKMRETAALLLRQLDGFSAHLAGAAVSGAVTRAHRLQLHAFADKPEMLEIFLHDQGLRLEQADRLYRYPGGREIRIPLVRFDARGLGVDAAVFPEDEIKRPPVNPTDGLPFKRLTGEGLARLMALSALPEA